MDLERHAVEPRSAELCTRHGAMEEDRPPRTGSRLRERLRRHHAEREAGIDDVGRQSLGCLRAAADDLLEADPPGVGHALVDVLERLALVQVRRVDRVTGFP
jgi:hypothetical protein